MLDEFDRALLTLVRAERPRARFHDGEPRRFDLDGKTWTTEWQQADAAGMTFFRLTDGNLASELVEQARQYSLLTASIAFKYDQRGPGQLADVAQHIGAKGWLNAVKVTFILGDEPIQRLVLAVVTDDGRTIESDTAARLFFLPADLHAESRGSGQAPARRNDQGCREVRWGAVR